MNPSILSNSVFRRSLKLSVCVWILDSQCGGQGPVGLSLRGCPRTNLSSCFVDIQAENWTALAFNWMHPLSAHVSLRFAFACFASIRLACSLARSLKITSFDNNKLTEKHRRILRKEIINLNANNSPPDASIHLIASRFLGLISTRSSSTPGVRLHYRQKALPRKVTI